MRAVWSRSSAVGVVTGEQVRRAQQRGRARRHELLEARSAHPGLPRDRHGRHVRSYPLGGPDGCLPLPVQERRHRLAGLVAGEQAGQSAARSSPWASIRATRSRLRIAFDSRSPWAAPVARLAQTAATSVLELGRPARPSSPGRTPPRRCLEHLAAQRRQRRGARVHPVVDGQADDRGGQAELHLGERERRVLGDDATSLAATIPMPPARTAPSTSVTTGLPIVATAAAARRSGARPPPSRRRWPRTGRRRSRRPGRRSGAARPARPGRPRPPPGAANSSVTSCRLSAFLLCGESRVIVASGPLTS